MAAKYLFVKYRAHEEHPELGQFKGQVIDITLPRLGEDKRGSKEGEWLGFTKMPVNKELWDKLLTGTISVDTEKCTHKRIAFSNKQDIFRVEATKFVSSNESEWKESPYYQQPASKDVYYKYVGAFLVEFTRITKHIPINQLITYFPHAWLFPSFTRVLVGRDGVAIVFEYPRRPENTEVVIDNSKILDNLLLPHPLGQNYTSNGPTQITQLTCDDSHYAHIQGDGKYVEQSELGNPQFLLFGKSNHLFYDNLVIARNYGNGKATRNILHFAELFGDISESNFSAEKARKRARIYAEQWVSSKLSSGKTSSVSKLRLALEEFKDHANNPSASERDIECFLDSNAWIIERSMGYKRYYSQVTIKHDLLSRSERDIRPDKFLEGTNEFCDVFDLKKPNASIIVRKPNRTHASAVLTEALAQVGTYVDFVSEPLVREDLKKKGIRVLKPRGLVLIGRTPKNDLDAWEDIKNRHLPISIYTFDDVIDRMEAIISWVEEILKKANQIGAD